MTVERPSEVLARQLRTWRRRRKLSAQDVADRIASDGGTLNRVAISKIENGDRGVSLDEWLQLAYALCVEPPVLLFIDTESDRALAVLPNAAMPARQALEWATGDGKPLCTNCGGNPPTGFACLVCGRKDAAGGRGLGLIAVLVDARQRAGLSPAEVAERTGWTAEQVTDFERVGGDPYLSQVRAYALAVGAEVHHTMGEIRS